jgi:dTDP-4-dehydrorhamnose reductase
MVVAVTGAGGQLGQALQFIAHRYPELKFYFASSIAADITDKHKLSDFFKGIKPDFCINAAAYTAVDKAEAEPDKAQLINVEGAKNLAMVCDDFNTTLLHISTDFVFGGDSEIPYKEEDETNPQSVYGRTKRDGELEIRKALKEHYIIRTSWVYSQFGHNFMKTMLRIAKERTSITVVDDQTGSPTHAVDLAEALVSIILANNALYGTYHYTNEGETTWYGFAKKIFELNNLDIEVIPVPTSGFPTPAKRPAYSVLDTTLIKQNFGINIQSWQAALSSYQTT